MVIIGERIAEIRNKREMTQDELAKKAYISKQVISNLERGKTKTVSESVLNLISFALMITPDFLLGESEDPNKNNKGLTVPFTMLPPWDYDFEIKELMKAHSKNRKVENLLRNIVYYLTYAEDEDYGIRILDNVIEVIKEEDDKTIEILMKLTTAFKK